MKINMFKKNYSIEAKHWHFVLKNIYSIFLINVSNSL